MDEEPPGPEDHHISHSDPTEKGKKLYNFLELKKSLKSLLKSGDNLYRIQKNASSSFLVFWDFSKISLH